MPYFLNSLTRWLSTRVPYSRNYIKHPHSGSHPPVTAVPGFSALLWPPRIPGTHTVHRHPHMQNTQTYKIKKWNENECTHMGWRREGCVPEKHLFQNSGLRLPVSGSCSNSIPVSLEFSQALCLVTGLQNSEGSSHICAETQAVSARAGTRADEPVADGKEQNVPV